MKRYLILFLLLSPLWASAQSNVLEKKISVSFSNIPLEQALVTISSLAEVAFSYSDDIVPVQELVTLSVKDEELNKVLTKLFEDFRVEYKEVNGRIILRKAPAPLTQTVRGIVFDQKSELPIPGANIVLVDKSPLLGGTTDEEGNFRIINVPVGRATIRITSVGFQTRTLFNVLLGTGKELVLEIKLNESITAMEELVVTAEQDEQSILNESAVVSARTFSVEETKRYAGSLGDPARMASGFAGVTGASDERNALIVRGNSPRGVLWRVDGIEAPNPNHFATEGSSSGIVSVLSANVIDNSNFLTGAFPAVYGNALSAVFDMKLRRGNNERREHSFQAGVLGVEASTEGPLSKRNSSSYLLNYRYSTLNILDKMGVDLNEAGEFKNYQDLSFKLNYPTNNNGSISFFGIGGLSESNKQNASALSNDYSDMGMIGVTYDKILSEKTSITAAVSASGTNISRSNEIGGLSAGLLKVEENYDKSYVRASLLARHIVTDHLNIKGGIIYSRLFYDFYLRNLDPNNQAYQEIINFQERGNTGITQTFLSAEQNFSPSLTGIYGMHFIQFGLTNDFSIEPRAGIRWQVASDKTFSAGYGKHSRIENLQYYLARDHQVGGNEVQVNKNLGFTRANHFVVGYDQTLRRGHTLHFEGYFQALYNAPALSDPSAVYATINEDSGFISDTLLNTGRGRNYGIEISLEKSFSKNFYYIVNGSLYQSKFRIADGPERNSSYNGNYNIHLLAGREFYMGDRKDMLGINIKITSAGGQRYVPIDFEKSVEEDRQVHDWQNAFNPQLPDYFRADFQMVYRRNKPRFTTEWRLDIQNVTNHLNPAYYFYNTTSEQIEMKYQVGFIPILSYRIEF